MKKDLSVLSFAANRTFYWVLITIVIGAAVQLFTFSHRLSSDISFITSNGYSFEYNSSFLSQCSMFNRWFLIMIGAVLIILSGASSKNAKYEYRLRLLNVSERKFFILSTIYNIAVFILIWLAESAVLSIAVRMYTNSATYTDGPQGIFVNLGSSASFQRFILLDDTGVFISTIAAMIAFGIVAGYIQMQRKTNRIPILAACIYAAYFVFSTIRISIDLQDRSHTYILCVSLIVFIVSLCLLAVMCTSLDGGNNTEVDDGL